MALVRRFPVGGSTEDPAYQPGEQPGLVRRTATAGGLMPPSTDPTALTGPKVPGETLRDPLAPQMPRTVSPGSVPPRMGGAVAAPPTAAPYTAPQPREKFNVDGYLSANKDVADAISGGAFNRDPYQHYTEYGQREGRSGWQVPETPAVAPSSASTSPTGPVNTDGYATPGYTPGNVGGVMAGWEESKWNDPSHQTPKYAVGRILSQYAGTGEGLAQAIPEIQKAYPGTTFNGKDKLSIPGVGVIDVLRAAGLGGQGFQWIPDEGAGIPDAYVPPTAESGQPNEEQQRDALLAALEGRTPRTRRYRKMTEEA
jgi:hypothetical protein